VTVGQIGTNAGYVTEMALCASSGGVRRARGGWGVLRRRPGAYGVPVGRPYL